MVRIEPTADGSFAAIRERSRLGIAIAAMIRMIATTISSSISEKPFCLRISGPLSCFLLEIEFLVVVAKSYNGWARACPASSRELHYLSHLGGQSGTRTVNYWKLSEMRNLKGRESV